MASFLLCQIAVCGAGATGSVPASIADCESVGGGAVPTRAVASSGSTVEARFIADGDLRSYASVEGANAVRTTLRATARRGMTYPAGRRAGAWMLTPSRDTDTVTIQTYLAGRVMESSADPGTLTRFVSVGDTDAVYAFFTTRTAFDSVELVLGGTAPFRVYEICSEGGAAD
jgi:hypothetical protein